MAEHAPLFADLRRRLHRIRQGWRCIVGIHRWQGHHDLGDGVNVATISGYRKPRGINDWRVCSWCGARATALRIGDDRIRTFAWRRLPSRAPDSHDLAAGLAALEDTAEGATEEEVVEALSESANSQPGPEQS